MATTLVCNLMLPVAAAMSFKPIVVLIPLLFFFILCSIFQVNSRDVRLDAMFCNLALFIVAKRALLFSTMRFASSGVVLGGEGP